MNTYWTGIHTCKERHKTGSRWNNITTDHKEGEQLEDRRNVGENSCNSGDGTDQTGPILDIYDDDDADVYDDDDDDDFRLAPSSVSRIRQLRKRHDEKRTEKVVEMVVA